MGPKKSVGNADAQHEERQGTAFSILAANYSCAIPLGVNAPPAKVGADPLRWNSLESFSSKAPDVLKAVPWIHLSLEPLGALRLGFLNCIGHKSKKPTASFLWRWVDECRYLKKTYKISLPAPERTNAQQQQQQQAIVWLRLWLINIALQAERLTPLNSQSVPWMNGRDRKNQKYFRCAEFMFLMRGGPQKQFDTQTSI
jgi:hypothetical protein